ncbi:hypothetical protein C7K25_04270 [Gulosibacter molinativorax]|uniref:Uncharacterized protein n=1 Tax=Gulosibacter molinativorax TaxID=256821 RepID=A0ABT7C658_9MICO|nr:hypothetical protein [Gulosibacter molinativorax]
MGLRQDAEEFLVGAELERIEHRVHRRVVGEDATEVAAANADFGRTRPGDGDPDGQLIAHASIMK